MNSSQQHDNCSDVWQVLSGAWSLQLPRTADPFHLVVYSERERLASPPSAFCWSLVNLSQLPGSFENVIMRCGCRTSAAVLLCSTFVLSAVKAEEDVTSIPLFLTLLQSVTEESRQPQTPRRISPHKTNRTELFGGFFFCLFFNHTFLCQDWVELQIILVLNLLVKVMLIIFLNISIKKP